MFLIINYFEINKNNDMWAINYFTDDDTDKDFKNILFFK